MAAIFSFTCTQCGRLHEGSPSFGFDAPAPYLEQPEAVRLQGELGPDLCRYVDADGEHRFVRCVLEIPIHGVAEPFTWGVWASLSASSYQRYVALPDRPDASDVFFGWFCNYLPGYPDTYALKTRVHPRDGGLRPWLELEPSPHPLAVDYHDGIGIARAQELAAQLVHR